MSDHDECTGQHGLLDPQYARRLARGREVSWESVQPAWLSEPDPQDAPHRRAATTRASLAAASGELIILVDWELWTASVWTVDGERITQQLQYPAGWPQGAIVDDMTAAYPGVRLIEVR
jgi:hypothetical protein